GVGRRVEKHQLDALAREKLACLARALRRVDEPRRDDLGTEPAQLLFDPPLVALEPLAQTLELRPVGVEADPEEADAGHCASAWTAAAWRLAPALRRRVRARR